MKQIHYLFFWGPLFFLSAAFGVFYPSPTHAISNTAINTLSANGEVKAIATGADGTTYLGGTFTQIGPYVGMGVPLSPSTGLLEPVFPIVNGQISAVAPDGSGGRYIGGTFTRVGSYDRSSLAHIFADGTVDPAWNPDAGAGGKTVYAIAVSGTTIYVGGDFNYIGGVTRSSLAAIGTDGTLQSWNPKANGIVYAIAVSGTTIYVGGAFTVIGGTTRNKLAAIGTDGTLQSWNPNANDIVQAIAVSGTTIYVGGWFSTIGGVTRNRLAAIDAGSASATAWDPNAGNTVSAIALSGTTIYVGGNFTAIGGTARRYLAAIGTDGTLQSWNPNASGVVYTIAVSGTTIYVGGDFTTIGGTTRNYLAAIGTDGTLQSWNPNVGGTVKTIDVSNSNVYVGGSIMIFGGTTRNRLAAIGTDGTLQSWNPNADRIVNAIAVSGTNIYVGGSFTTMGGTERNRLAAIGTDGTLQSWNPNANNGVYAIAVSGTTIYVGGNFTTIGGVTRNRLAAIDAGSASGTAWDPNTNGYVYTIAVSGTTIYVGGAFTVIGGTTRNKLAAIGTDGTLQSWDPNAGNTVSAIALSGTTIYVGGNFTAIGGTARRYLAAIGTDGTLQSWNPNANNTVSAIAVSGADLYVGGYFTGMASSLVSGFAAFDVLAPIIVITAPTLVSNTTITNTTIQITDNHGVTASNVSVNTSTTAGTSGFSCTQTSVTVVDCTIQITSSGTLVINATDDADNTGTQSKEGYVVESTPPVITITAPQKLSNAAITNTTIQVTDNNGINMAQVIVDSGSTVNTSSFVCTQTNVTTVDCTVTVDDSGDLVITATDLAGNSVSRSETGYVIVSEGPVISNVASVPTDEGAAITWTTDSLSSSKVTYGPDTPYTTSTSELDTSPRVTSHTVVLSNLIPCSTYRYAVVSTDALTNATTGTDSTFTTSGCINGMLPLSQTAQTIGTSGGSLSLTYDNETVSLSVPNGYSLTAANFQIKTLDGTAALAVIGTPIGVRAVGTYIWNIHALLDSDTVLGIVTGGASITMSYSDQDISGLEQSSLKIYKNSAGAWTELSGCVIDTTAKTVTCATDSFSTFGLFGTPIVAGTNISGGGSMPSWGTVPPTGPFSVNLQTGESATEVTTVTLNLSASSDVNRMAISRFADFHDAGIVPFANSVRWPICGASLCTPGVYDVYVKFYQEYGVASPAQHLVITYTPVLIGTIESDKGLPFSSVTHINCRDGNLLRGTLSAVYYCATDGKRYLFPNEKTFFTWYANFQGVLRINDRTLGDIPLGTNVTYRPDVRLLKLQSSPRVYQVFQGGVLRWVTTEATAKSLFGPNWNKMIDDLPEVFFVDYTVGPPITMP